jgi:chloramphenicol O-acetyltransferase type A
MIKIDLETWNRKNHYLLYKDFLNPYFTISANVDVTRLIGYDKQNGFPFFASFLFLVMKVLNKIPEFRTRIRTDGVALHEIVHPSYTVMTEENLFRFVTTPFVEDMKTFVENVLADIDRSKKTVSLEDAEGVDDLVFVSSLKWLSFTSVSHPYDNKKPDSFPRITWGRYFPEGNKILIPLSVMAHHSLCDGEHACSFYNGLQNEIFSLE